MVMNHFALLLHHLTRYLAEEDHTINKNHYQTAVYMNRVFRFLFLSFLSKIFKHLKVKTYKVTEEKRTSSVLLMESYSVFSTFQPYINPSFQ